MAKTVSETTGEFYQHYPRSATIVTAQHEGRKNAMAVAWHTSLSFEPPVYGVCISPRRFTYQLIVGSKEFGINFVSFELAETVASLGGSSGKELDKFQKLDIAIEKPLNTGVPVLRDAYATYECQLIDDREYGDHRLMVGKILAVHVREEAFNREGILDLDKIKPLLYLGAEHYVTLESASLKPLDRDIYGKRVI